jgi:hypothetical protein
MDNNKKKHVSYSSSLINLTPHSITVFTGDDGGSNENGVIYPTEQDKKVVRVRSRPQELVAILENGISVFTPQRFETDKDGQAVLENFPYSPDINQEHPDIIVPMLVGNHIPKWYRGKVYIPDTGPFGVVRDKDGKIIGTKHLCLVHSGEESN